MPKRTIYIFDSNFRTATFIHELEVIISYKVTGISNPKPKLQRCGPLSTWRLLPKEQLQKRAVLHQEFSQRHQDSTLLEKPYRERDVYFSNEKLSTLRLCLGWMRVYIMCNRLALKSAHFTQKLNKILLLGVFIPCLSSGHFFHLPALKLLCCPCQTVLPHDVNCNCKYSL